MKQATGVCKYCGQVMTIEVPDSYSQEDVDIEVRKRCDCTHGG